MSLIRPVKGRAKGQASSNTETHNGKVLKAYADANGNVTAADVLLDGYTVPLTRVANASGLRLSVGGFRVVVNWHRGSRFAPQIVGAAGGESGSILSASERAVTDQIFGVENRAVDLSGIPFLLQSEDTEATPDGYVELPGANVFFEDTAPSEDTSGGALNGRRIVDAVLLKVTSLPDPAATTLRDGTLANLLTSYGASLGLWRLDLSLLEWVRVDVGDHKVKTSEEDGTAEYLFSSLVGGDGIELEEIDVGGGNKRVRITAAEGAGGARYLPISNGDRFDPCIVFDGDGSLVLIEY